MLEYNFMLDINITDRKLSFRQLWPKLKLLILVGNFPDQYASQKLILYNGVALADLHSSGKMFVIEDRLNITVNRDLMSKSAWYSLNNFAEILFHQVAFFTVVLTKRFYRQRIIKINAN